MQIRKIIVSFPNELAIIPLKPISGIRPKAPIHKRLGQSIATVSQSRSTPANIPATVIPDCSIPAGAGINLPNIINKNPIVK